MRHLDCTDLWVQDKIRSKRIELEQILGAEHAADILTKYVEKVALDKALVKMGLHKMAGRPAGAPVAMGA